MKNLTPEWTDDIDEAKDFIWEFIASLAVYKFRNEFPNLKIKRVLFLETNMATKTKAGG